MRILTIVVLFISLTASSQTKSWKLVDSTYGPLPKDVHVYYTDTPTDTFPFRAFYITLPLKKSIRFFTDTTVGRRLSPKEFYDKNKKPLVTVNGTFFSFATSQNLNLVIREGKVVSYNDPKLKRGVYSSAIGISKTGQADVAWTVADTGFTSALAIQKLELGEMKANHWEVETAIGGGPVLVQNGEVQIYNNEEKKFGGKGLYDRHPRTAMGYTKDGKLIIMVVEGRNSEAAGADLLLLAQLLKEAGCEEALNLDGGGSSCLLINGKETIRPSDKVQRKVPAVFMAASR